MLRSSTWLLCAWLVWTGAAAARELTAEEAAGKHIYLHGSSASGAELHARVGPDGTVLPASVLPCAGCHGSDGRGRREGGLSPPDITWRRLTTSGPGPAYNEATFARALSEGLDAAGNRLNPAMPRFVMAQRDMAALTAYIKRLEQDLDPGLHEESLRLGTLLPASGPLAAPGRTVAALLQGAIARINEQGGIHGRRLELVSADPGPDRASAEAALRELLERQDIFALVAPLAPALEGRLGELLAQGGVPLVGPLLQLTGEPGSRLIFDPLPGLREQLFALGEFAGRRLELQNSPALIAYPAEPRQQRLAEALAARLQAHGWGRVQLFAYGAGSQASTGPVAGPGLRAVFFLGPGQALGGLALALQEAGQVPYLFAAANQVGGMALQLPEPFSGRLFLAYPYLPEDRTPAGTAALQALRQRSGLGSEHGVLQVGAYSALLVLAEGLKRAGRDASREKLMDALENLHSFPTGVTPEVGFGPGQRVGAAGAHIVTVNLAERRLQPTGQYIRLEPGR